MKGLILLNLEIVVGRKPACYRLFCQKDPSITDKESYVNIGEERNGKVVVKKNDIENYDNEGERIKDEGV